MTLNDEFKITSYNKADLEEAQKIANFANEEDENEYKNEINYEKDELKFIGSTMHANIVKETEEFIKKVNPKDGEVMNQNLKNMKKDIKKVRKINSF